MQKKVWGLHSNRCLGAAASTYISYHLLELGVCPLVPPARAAGPSETPRRDAPKLERAVGGLPPMESAARADAGPHKHVPPS